MTTQRPSVRRQLLRPLLLADGGHGLEGRVCRVDHHLEHDLEGRATEAVWQHFMSTLCWSKASRCVSTIKQPQKGQAPHARRPSIQPSSQGPAPSSQHPPSLRWPGRRPTEPGAAARPSGRPAAGCSHHRPARAPRSRALRIEEAGRADTLDVTSQCEHVATLWTTWPAQGPRLLSPPAPTHTLPRTHRCTATGTHPHAAQGAQLRHADSKNRAPSRSSVVCSTHTCVSMPTMSTLRTPPPSLSRAAFT